MARQASPTILLSQHARAVCGGLGLVFVFVFVLFAGKGFDPGRGVPRLASRLPQGALEKMVEHAIEREFPEINRSRKVGG